MVRILGTLLLETAGSAVLLQSGQGWVTLVLATTAMVLGLLPEASRFAEKLLAGDPQPDLLNEQANT
jgi:hypothetical protein